MQRGEEVVEHHKERCQVKLADCFALLQIEHFL